MSGGLHTIFMTDTQDKDLNPPLLPQPCWPQGKLWILQIPQNKEVKKPYQASQTATNELQGSHGWWSWSSHMLLTSLQRVWHAAATLVGIQAKKLFKAFENFKWTLCIMFNFSKLNPHQSCYIIAQGIYREEPGFWDFWSSYLQLAL